MEAPHDPTSRLQPEDKEVFVKVAGLLTWLTGLLVLAVTATGISAPARRPGSLGVQSGRWVAS